MVPAGVRRETHLLTLGIRSLDVRFAALPLLAPVLQLKITNLRNRPLCSTAIDSIRETCLSLYHSFVTGSTHFPHVPYKGFFRTVTLFSPFQVDEDGYKAGRSQLENIRPSPVMDQPPGLMPSPVPRAFQTLLLPAHAERRSGLTLTPRCRLRRVTLEDWTVTRVISPVYYADGTKLRNRWRVTDYHTDGHMLMSVVCRFINLSLPSVETPKKRGLSEEDDSDSNPRQKKRLRL